MAHDNLLNEVQKKLLVVPRKRKMLKACMSVLKIQKSRFFNAVIQVIALDSFRDTGPFMKKTDCSLPNLPPCPYETIDPYLRLYIYDHWTKS